MTKPDLSFYFDNVLRFLDDKMFATNEQIGAHLGSRGRGFGTKVARQMGKEGLLTWLRDEQAWRISNYGRDRLCKVGHEQG